MKAVLGVAMILLGAAACDVPPLALKFRLTAGTSQQCVGDSGDITTSCSDITMICDGVLSVRIVPPDDPSVPYISLCRRLSGGQRKLCSIATEDLPVPTVPIPEQVLEVQMAVFPDSVVGTDPETGALVCPRVEFGANNLPIAAIPACNDPDPGSCPRVPAVGGRAFYTPGDSETVVDLGCTDLQQLTDELTCEGVRRVSVTASVNDFDALVSSIDRSLADRIDVSIGEPTRNTDGTYRLDSVDTFELSRTDSSIPSWSALLDTQFTEYVCLEVLEGGAQQTSALTCRTAQADASMIDISGTYLRKSTLDDVLGALDLTSFPPGGLVVGIVVDRNFNPLANVGVACPGCSVVYLNALLTSTQQGATSSSGVFVSLNAPFGTRFSLPSSPLAPAVLGGRIDGKVTIVILQDKEPDPI